MKNKKILGMAIAAIFVSVFVAHTPQTRTEKTSPSPKPIARSGQPATQATPSSSAPSTLVQPVSSARSTAKTNDTSQLQDNQTSLIITKDSSKVVAYAKTHQIYIERTINYGNLEALLVNLSVDSPVLTDLKQADNEIQLTPNYRYSPAMTPTDPGFGSQWNLSKIQLPEAWEYSQGSSSVTLAVIDSGILSSQSAGGTTYTTPDLPSNRFKQNSGEVGTTQSGDRCWTGTAANKTTNNCDDDNNGYIDDYRGWDFMGGFRGNAGCPNNASPTTYETSDHTYILEDNDPQPYSCDNASNTSLLNKNDFNGDCKVSACATSHGTMVASVAAAGVNDTSIAGVNPNVKLLNLRIFDGYGYTDSARIAEAILYAKNNGAQVINLSLAFLQCDGIFVDPTIESALSAAKTAGLTVVVASGNSNTSNVCYPASSDKVIAVGATDTNDNRASFSSYGTQLDVSAPGKDVPADFAPNAADGDVSSGFVSGTSFAAPTVAGVVSIVKGIIPSATPDQIKDIITLRGDIVPGMNGLTKTNLYGAGRLNAQTSVRVALGQLPVYSLQISTMGLPENILTNSIAERNSYMSNTKLSYQGIAFWDTGSNYDQTLQEYRNSTQLR